MREVPAGPRTAEPRAAQARSAKPRPAEPRTLADDLRARSDEALVALLRVRPDLLTPVPNDVTSLVARATTRASVTRALEWLDRFTLQVVDAFVCLPDPTPYSAILALLTDRDHPGAGSETSVAAAIDRLRTYALVWGPDDALRLVRTVREIVGPPPLATGPPVTSALDGFDRDRLDGLLADLGLPETTGVTAAVTAVADLFSDPDRLGALVDGAPPPAREVLDRLAVGSPYGLLERADRQVRAAGAASPVEWLLARALLVPSDPHTVVLPREVAWHLRRGRLPGQLEPAPPPLDVVEHDAALTDRTAAGAAFTATRAVEDLLDAWALDPPPALRTGGLGVRELRRSAAALDVDTPVAALYAETAHAAGLLAPDDADREWLPTLEYDGWRGEQTPRRWATLASAWLATSRVPGLVGERDDRDRPISLLGADLDRTQAAEVRRDVLGVLAALPPGASATADSILARLRWTRPRRTGRFAERLVEWTLREAEQLGVTGRGALSAAGRALLAGDADEAARALAPLLPAPLDHVLLQADLTAIAPGPLTQDLAHALALAADVESTGGATVYRFTPSSVRRALDAGNTAADLHALLAEHSRTPVPQPLRYLIDDVARRHGRIRVGAASAYVRCDDETLISELLADRRMTPLMLRRLAPTVLAGQAPPDLVLTKLRDAGYAPAAESGEGEIVVSRPDSLRTANRPRPANLFAEPTVPRPALLAAAVKAIRAGDRAATTPRRPLAADPDRPATAATGAIGGAAGGSAGVLPRTTPAESLAALQDAAAGQAPLWIGYVNAEGGASQRVIEPIRVEGGYVTAFDHIHDEVRTFAIHRITGVAAIGAAPEEADELPDG